LSFLSESSTWIFAFATTIILEMSPFSVLKTRGGVVHSLRSLLLQSFCLSLGQYQLAGSR
jgi:hypothetical protein